MTLSCNAVKGSEIQLGSSCLRLNSIDTFLTDLRALLQCIVIVMNIVVKCLLHTVFTSDSSQQLLNSVL